MIFCNVHVLFLTITSEIVCLNEIDITTKLACVFYILFGGI